MILECIGGIGMFELCGTVYERVAGILSGAGISTRAIDLTTTDTDAILDIDDRERWMAER